MIVRLEAVVSAEQAGASVRVRREVFGPEWGIENTRIASVDLPRANHLIARVLPDLQVVATVTVLDTTGNSALHEKYGIPFAPHERVARYTQMAVLKPFRGLNLPLYMVLEARRLYVVPNDFMYTWFLFREDRAASSKFCTALGFSASSQIVHGEQGPSRFLLRHEKGHEARVADMQARSFLDAVRPKQLQVVTASDAYTSPAAAELAFCAQ